MAVNSQSKSRRASAVVGAVAIGLLLIFTVLALVGLLSAFEWLIADVLVAVVANIFFRIIRKRNQ